MKRYKALVVAMFLPACAALLGCNGQPVAPQVRSTDPPAKRKAGLDKLARSDHIALIESCLANYDALRKSYTCTFVKQERLRGVMGKRQTVSATFMDSPFSVGMKWTENPAGGDRVLYVEGKYDGDMLVRPMGLISLLVSTAKVKPDGPDAMRSTRRPVSLFGFKRAMQSLLEVYRRAKAGGDLKQACDGYVKLAGRDAIVLVRRLPDGDKYRPDAPPVTKIYIDLDYLVPIMIEGFEADGKTLIARYQYKDVNFNAVVGADDFQPAKFDLIEPK